MVSAPGSESIALGHALVCPGVSLGGDKLGGLPAWGPLGLNLLSGCRVRAVLPAKRRIGAAPPGAAGQATHTHTFALRLNRDPRSVGQCVSTTPARTHTHTHTCVHKRYICRTVAHWRFYARDLRLALGGPA
eukprot:GHVR01110517.1.p2 GENE.GHVR01110517.1~~GHVR01110517.1.p2  ORF type:complete len:132 (+),score=28.17 GHVR01110517.1:736-1131(+)